MEDLLGEAVTTRWATTGLPVAGTILIDTNAAGIGWYLDEIREDDTEFGRAGVASKQIALHLPSGERNYDLRTVIAHEFGHLLGLDDMRDGDSIMGHLLAPSQRKYVADADVQMLLGVRQGLTQRASLGRNYQPSEPPTMAQPFGGPGTSTSSFEPDLAVHVDSQSAFDQSQDLVAPQVGNGSSANGIINGAFAISAPSDDDFGWDLRGSADVDAGVGVLSEDARLLSGFSQTFVAPDSVQTLEFTILSASLGSSELNPRLMPLRSRWWLRIPWRRSSAPRMA